MLYPCKFGNIAPKVMSATSFTNGTTITGCKAGDIIFANITIAYVQDVNISNANKITKTVWQAGTGSTWGFCYVFQVQNDGDVVISAPSGGGKPSVTYSHVTQD